MTCMLKGQRIIVGDVCLEQHSPHICDEAHNTLPPFYFFMKSCLQDESVFLHQNAENSSHEPRNRFTLLQADLSYQDKQLTGELTRSCFTIC